MTQTPSPMLRARIGNTVLWYDGPVIFWAAVPGADILAMATPDPVAATDTRPAFDHIGYGFNAETRHRFMHEGADLLELMRAPDAPIWGLDFEGYCRPTQTAPAFRLYSELHDDLLPDPGVTWNSFAGPSRRTRP